MRALSIDRRGQLAFALALTLAIAGVDVAVGDDVLLVPLLVAGPLLTAWRWGSLVTGAVGAVAIALALLCGVLTSMFGASPHVVGTVAVAVGSVLAVALSETRDREHRAAVAARRERQRAALLAQVSDLLDRGGALEQVLGELAALTLPDMADTCAVDLLGPGGEITPLVLRSRDPERAERLLRVRAADPLDPASEHPIAVALRTGRTQTGDLSPSTLTAMGMGERGRVIGGVAGYGSCLAVPLSARGRLVGCITLVRLAEEAPYDADDAALLEEFARRAGLVIDHARLFGALAETEAELDSVLAALAEAVLVQDLGGETVYANQAAADLLGFADPAELVREGVAGAFARWDVRTQRGDEIVPERLPNRRAASGELPEPMILRATDRHSGDVRFWLLKSRPVLDHEGAPRLAVSVVEDVTRTKRDELEQRFLAQVSKLLSSSLDLDVTLEKIAWAAVPELADWCAVDMPDERGRLRRVATADVDLARLHQPQLAIGALAGPGELAAGPPQVLRTGRSELWEDIGEDLLERVARSPEQLELLRATAPRSALVVPLVAGERILGTISLGTTRDSQRRLTGGDVSVAEELGRRAGIALENARVHGERSSIAATLQEALLPPRLPVIPGLSIAARFRAAGEAWQVGGDFYDLFPVGDAWMVLMGDVTGKGPQAASITSLARYTMRTAARYETSPARVLERLNEALGSEIDRRQLCSAVCARVEPGAGGTRLVVACAGHPLPLHALNGRGDVATAGVPGTLLGAFADGDWTDVPVELAPGESIVLYTDGVTDTRGPGDRFGIERLEAVVRAASGRPADDTAARIDEELMAFEVGEQRDDVALLVMQAVAGGSAAGGTTAIVSEGEA